ncbi:hypothetical protein F3Y22_tig00110403pilonHSYRG00172 [Hibiscus syriacus]|uniref:R13L1/DRL21-like LRR repeat region domain-containing protein n=1 Tax=Hibiscus syriacus TaxID=106335 RepID=A0A6A3AQY5_HIBSY|nr:hypothetical protein F3Y22_tig00110403pilonHSYRG00172 [Hibiscus syriacus]
MMPLGIGNLTNLQRLSNFVIGEGDGHRIGELKNLLNLRGDFDLSRLENVNGQDSREARLNEKSGITKLVLKWGGDFEKPTRNNEVEEQVLDSLHPPKKLEQLVIENFGGVKFSTWIADSSFRNLSSLKLFSCKNCKSLPLIGRLSSLKDLSIGGLVEVRKIGNELFGENQSVAFASLEVYLSRVYQTGRSGMLVKVMNKFQSYPCFVSCDKTLSSIVGKVANPSSVLAET